MTAKKIDNNKIIVKIHFIIFLFSKNSITNKEIKADNPAKIPMELKEPRILSGLPPNIPNDNVAGINK